MHGAVQVDVRLGPASETLDTLAAEGKRFDLAFLDADKTGYLGYYKKVGPNSRFPGILVLFLMPLCVCCLDMIDHRRGVK